MKYAGIREEELKNKVAQEYFWQYDCTKIIGNVDFCVSIRHSGGELFEQESLMWAEAKSGKSDIYKSLVQLILTIGKSRTFDRHLPPPFLGAFDAENIAFIPYNDIHDIFYQNDFNWNVTPSNHDTKEFKLVLDKVKSIIERNALMHNYESDDKDIHKFIKNNFIVGKFGITKIKIDKNNFMVIYNKWLSAVKPSIAVNWDALKSKGIIDGDFYLADLLSQENESLKDKLYVLLRRNLYELDRTIDDSGLFNSKRAEFNDEQKAHNQFWNKYERPPKEEYWDYIIERRDLLVPQDVRERKGSFFTPQIWVELSQKYLTDALGEDWQDEYYLWDCAAGTGNLLTGLTNKYNVWASTLDRQDVDVMKDRIKNGANLLEDHVFQFDFLNDEFDKLPAGLQNIVNDPEKRKKLVMYINPPYAETATNETSNKDRINKRGVSFTKVQELYSNRIGIATKELFAQFLTRIYSEIPDSIIAEFSKMKFIQGPNFYKFRQFFKAQYISGFVVPANTFDNVKGTFPIGFMLWKTTKSNNKEKELSEVICDVYNENSNFIGKRVFFAYEDNNFITDWYRKYHTRVEGELNIGAIGLYGSDFQHNNFIRITDTKNHPNRYTYITKYNVIETSIYLSVRHCIEATWLNDRDQFLYPNDGWSTDAEFQNDCLAFALFHGQNRISSKEGTNHWIPFTEQEVDAREKFESNFMTQYIKGKLGNDGHQTGKDVPHLPSVAHLTETELFQSETNAIQHRNTPLEFSPEAIEVFEAGRKLWRYYHKCIKTHKNPSQTLPKGEGFKNQIGKTDKNPSQTLPKGEGFKSGNGTLAPYPSGRAGVGSPYPSVNASLYDIREYFQGRNDKGKMNNKSDDAEYMELIKDLRESLKILAKKIEPKVYEYGFLKA